MKNKELLNACYKLLNRFITVNKLIEMLEAINKDNLKEDEIKELDNLIHEIKKISNDIPNKEDEYIIKEKENIKKLIDRFETFKDKNDFFNKQLEHLKKDYEKERDSHERWFKVAEFIINNDYFNDSFDNLTDYEFLEFIAQNIQAPNPPNLSQKKFDKLVKVGIEKDEREWLWRLAFNYERKNINFDEIANYFIEKKDVYYLSELISAVGYRLNIDDMIEKINDKEIIEGLKERKSVMGSYISEEQFNKLISKLN